MSWNGVFKGMLYVCSPTIFFFNSRWQDGCRESQKLREFFFNFFFHGRWEDGCRESEKLRKEGVKVPEICEMHIQSDVGLRRLRHLLRNIDPP